MNVIKINVDFTNRELEKEGVSLVEDDYNSTKIVFTFDKEYTERKVFEMARPNTQEAFFIKEIVNNEIVLVGKTTVKDLNNYIKYVDDEENVYWYDENNNILYNAEYVEQTEISVDDLTKVLINASLFTEPGKYPIEISLYNGDSKLTSLKSTLTVKEEAVKTNDQDFVKYIPIMDNLINEAIETIDRLEQEEETITEAEQTRQENEQTRQTNESERQENETARENAEDDRSNAETERIANEQSRTTAEQERETAEDDRSDAETNREDAENDREEAEAERVTAEQNRATAEQSRATAETSRSNAEQSRVTAENSRVSAETTRATAETSRANAESSRVTAENSRVSAETTRAIAETSRVNAENSRVTAETNRASAETTRQSNETTRINNENLRIINEQTRQAKMSMINDFLKDMTAEGTNIHVTDSANYSAKLDFEGFSRQETAEDVPTPEFPIEIQNLEGTLTFKKFKENYFNANNIVNTNIVVTDNGKTITMPIATSGNGITTTSAKLKELCPNLKVGDTVYLYFTRNLGTTYNNFIYFAGNIGSWNNGTVRTITQENLDATISLYGNRFNSGETEQCILTDFRIVKKENAVWEQFYNAETIDFPLAEGQKMYEGSKTISTGIYNNKISYTFNGTENWELNSNGNLFVLRGLETGKIVAESAVANILSNYYKASSFIRLYNALDDYGISFGSTSADRICIRNKDITTVADFKTWLSTHNLTVEYELAEATITEYTPEQQEAYNELQNWSTYRGTTNITNSQDANMNLAYKKDLQMQLQELQTALVAIGGEANV